jgi:septum formation topological specificity factor MinE
VKIPKRHECTNWESIFQYAGADAVISVFNAVHSQQCSYKPYPEAESFLKWMKTRFYVIIASHRKAMYKPELVEWLKTNNLTYDEVHVSMDKGKLFADPRVEVVIDDRDSTIIEAMRHGKIGIGLRKPWNCKSRYTGSIADIEFYDVPLTLFDNLTDIQDFLSNYHSSHKYVDALKEEVLL